MFVIKRKKVKYKIAILYICIGKYEIFWDEFFESSENLFCKKHHKEYFIFTDSNNHFVGEETKRVHKICWEDLGWPDNSLKRFDMFISIEEDLKKFDFVFFMNANMMFVKEVDENFLPIVENFTLVEHFLFYNQTPLFFSYDRNPKSTAFIPHLKGEYYVRGSVNGAKTKNFLEMIHSCSKAIKENESKGIISVWHDETHLNAYVLGRKDLKILDPGFSFAEGDNQNFEIFILAREKNHYFDVNQLKNTNFSQLEQGNKRNVISWIKRMAKIALSLIFFPRVIRRIRKKYGKINWG